MQQAMPQSIFKPIFRVIFQRSTVVILASTFIAVVFALVCASSAYATSSQTLQQQAREASSRISGMEQQLATKMRALNEASEELSETRRQITEGEYQALVLEGSIEQNRQSLATQATFMYRSEGFGYLEMILRAQTVSEFTSKLQLVDMLATQDAQTIEDLLVQTAQHDELLEELYALRAKQERVEEARRADVQAAQSSIDEQQAYIQSLNAQVRQALQREQEQRNRREATRPAAPSGSARESGATVVSAPRGGGGGGGSNDSGYVNTGVSFSGIASWYEIGTRTANGEAFNPNAMTAAHPSLPFNTLVRVTFNGRSVVVRINDRGPFTGGRIIDLSRGSAEVIGLRSAGIGTVRVEVVQRP